MQAFVFSFNKQSTTGDQNIDLSSISGLPNLALMADGTWAAKFIMSGSDASSTTWDQHLNLSKGFAANYGGTMAQYVSQLNIDDNQITTQTSRRLAAAIVSINYTEIIRAEAVMGAVPFPTATTMRINWTTNTASAPWGTPTIICILLTGLTYAKVINRQTPTVVGTKDTTTLAFEPDYIETIGAGMTALGSSTHGRFGYGIMNKHGQQIATAIASDDATTPSNSSRWQRTDSDFLITDGSESVHTRASFVSMLSNGFREYYSTTQGSTEELASLCIKGVSSKIGSFVPSGATGSKTFTTRHGFIPKLAMFMGIHSTPISTPSASMCWFFGASDLTRQRVCADTDVDNANPTRSDNVWRDDAVILHSSDGATNERASLTSVSEDDITLNYASLLGLETGWVLLGDAGEDTYPAKVLV